jgi:hypothetical protein
VYGAAGWSQTVESPARKIVRTEPAGVTDRPLTRGAEPAKRRSRPAVPVPPCPVGCPSGSRTFTVTSYRAVAPAAVTTTGNSCRRASAVSVVLPGVAPPKVTETS